MTIEGARVATQKAILARITAPLTGILAPDPEGGLAIFHGAKRDAPADVYPCLTYRTSVRPDDVVRGPASPDYAGGRIATVRLEMELWDDSPDSYRLSAAKEVLELQLENVAFDLPSGAGRCFRSHCVTSGEPNFNPNTLENAALLAYELQIQAA